MSVPFVVVSDFDGTITEEDLVVALTTTFHEDNEAVIASIQRREIDLKTGLTQLFSTLHSRDRLRYEEFIANAVRIRAEFHRFEQTLITANIPFYIVSNGLDFMLDAVLTSHHTPRISNHAVFDSENIRIDWQYSCAPPCPGGCGLCKFRVIDELRAQYQAPVVFIGDGITDLNGALNADRIYARDHLARYLAERPVPYTHFETFDDILESLFVLNPKGAQS